MNPHNPYAPPATEVLDIPILMPTVDIESLAVSRRWKNKFRLFEKAGGANLSRLRDLSLSERIKITFNFLSFLFGPIYYVIKGMWRKGLVLFVVCAGVVLTLAFGLELAGLGRLNSSLGYGVGIVFATRANIDYYKKMVLQQNGWW